MTDDAPDTSIIPAPIDRSTGEFAAPLMHGMIGMLAQLRLPATAVCHMMTCALVHAWTELAKNGPTLDPRGYVLWDIADSLRIMAGREKAHLVVAGARGDRAVRGMLLADQPTEPAN